MESSSLDPLPNQQTFHQQGGEQTPNQCPHQRCGQLGSPTGLCAGQSRARSLVSLPRVWRPRRRPGRTSLACDEPLGLEETAAGDNINVISDRGFRSTHTALRKVWKGSSPPPAVWPRGSWPSRVCRAVELPAGVADLDASLTETHSRLAVGSQAQVTGVGPGSQLLSPTG